MQDYQDQRHNIADEYVFWIRMSYRDFLFFIRFQWNRVLVKCFMLAIARNKNNIVFECIANLNKSEKKVTKPIIELQSIAIFLVDLFCINCYLLNCRFDNIWKVIRRKRFVYVDNIGCKYHLTHWIGKTFDKLWSKI